MADFMTWREQLGLSQVQAARALGLSRRIVQYYEAGEQQLPEPVRFAMSYLAEHPAKLKEAKTAPLPLNELQRAALSGLADGEPHTFDRKIGNALVSRRYAKEVTRGFVITAAGREALKRA
jgi:hypothetical protein